MSELGERIVDFLEAYEMYKEVSNDEPVSIIKSLQAENKRLTTSVEDLGVKCGSLLAENNRLREALEEMKHYVFCESERGSRESMSAMIKAALQHKESK